MSESKKERLSEQFSLKAEQETAVRDVPDKPEPAAPKSRTWRLVTLFPELGAFFFKFESVERILIGRGEHLSVQLKQRTAWVQIPDAFASERHLVLELSSGGWTAKDVSRNGSGLAGQPMPRNQPCPIQLTFDHIFSSTFATA